MKILILIDAWFPFVGGAQIQIKNLKQILKRDYNCEYFILHSPSVNILVRFLWSLWIIPQAFFYHRKHHFNLIHAHAYWPGIPGKILSKILNIPIVFTIHGSNLMDLKIKSMRAFLEKIILTKVRYNQMISVSSNFLKYKNVNKNITVIPNGVDVNLFDAIKIPKDKPYKILFVGRNDCVKGLKYLKQAMELVSRKIPQARLKIISSGLSQQELIKEYKSSHLFVLPSLSEGQPLTLLEAWAARLAVVVTSVGDNAQMVENGYNGYIVEPGKVKELTTTIIRILKNPQRDILGERGYQLVKNYYTWSRCAKRTYKIYKQALS